MARNSGVVKGLVRLAAAWALACAAGSVMAQGEPPAENVLGGPKVKDNSVPGAKSRFSSGKGDKKDRALDRGIAPGVYAKALDALRGEDVSEAVRLTAEQDEKIRAIHREFMESEREFMREHRAELVALRDQMPPEMRRRIDERLRSPKALQKGLPKDNAKKAGKGRPDPASPPPPMDEMDDRMMEGVDPAESARARDRMERIFAAAPKPKDAQSKVWALLSDAQRPVLQAELERLQKAGGKGGPGGPDAGPSGELREKLKNMSPEEREEFMREMRERRAAGKQGRGEEKPAPKRDSVKVPKPDRAPQGPE